MNTDPEETRCAKNYRELQHLAPISPWPQLGEKPLLLGSIGVDSGTVIVGDFISGCEAMKLYTLNGDGSYPVFLMRVNGRRCLVVDFEAHMYGADPYEDTHGTIAEWQCPQCGACEQSDSVWDGGSDVTCTNGHRTEYTDKAITGFDRFVDKEAVP